MTAFDDSPQTFDRLDWSLLQKGYVTLYLRTEYLNEDLDWLRHHQYAIIEFDADSWTAKSRMLASFAAAFAFPSSYGCNMDALNDCLFDIWIPNDGGMAILIRNFDGFAERDRSTSKSVLDILNDRCRVASLFGRRLIVILHVRNPQFRTIVFGEQTGHWNPREFLDSNRNG